MLPVADAARAQASATTTTTAAPQPSKPAIEYGPDTPRGALARFLAACRAGQYARAAEYLNLRATPTSARARRGPELARELEAVLDRALWVDLDKLSDRPEGDPNDSLPPGKDSLGTIETENGPVEILIERVPQAGSPPVWKIAATTVEVIPALYEEFGWGPLAKVLPAPFFQIRFLQIRLWQWIGLWLVATIAWAVSRVFRGVTVRLARRILAAQGRPNGGLAEHAAAPLRLLIGLLVFASGTRFLALAVPVDRFLIGLQSALAIIAFTWFLLRLLDVLAVRVEQRLLEHRHARAVAAVPFGRRAVKIFVAIIALVAALQNFGFNVTGIVAGLGLGGLAVALAAQKTLENLFGSVSLVADQPVRVGDVCRFGETVGTVEDIGLRSTRLRTNDRTIVTVPNAQFSTLALENLSRRDRIPVRATLTLPHGTGAGRVREVLTALRDMVVAQPKVEADSARAHFARITKDALEIEMRAYVMTSRWEEFVEIREQILLRALEIVGATDAALG